RVLLFRYFTEQFDELLIGLPGLRRKAGYDVAKVAAVKCCALVDLPRKKALAQRAERNEADSELFQRRQHLLFGLSPPKRIFTLKRCHGLDRVCATDRSHTCFGESEVLDFPSLNQIFHCPRK